jgi:hypothetical protein
MQKKIFILSPSKFTSGGPELLHQLCHELNMLGFMSYMHYVDGESTNDRVPEVYKTYNLRVSEIIDTESNLIIIPESYPSFVNKYSKIRVCFWWLSVDNYFQTFKDFRKEYYLKISYFERLLIKLKLKTPEPLKVTNKIFSNNVFHLAQSFYAVNFLQEKGLSAELLSDYINDSFLDMKVDFNKKANIILYNPAKGLNNLKPFFEKEINGVWVPLQNMSKKNIIKLMEMSKLYIDFGNHPGKDRFPREAALMGCCIITNRLGAANNNNDIKIPDEFKFDSILCENEILEKINLCIDKYESEIVKFLNYCEGIKNEKDIFKNQVFNIFSKLLK